METAKEIREHYDKLRDEEIKKIQETCPHTETHDSYECWAPGHFTGRVFEVCNKCEKVLVAKGGVPKGKVIDVELDNNQPITNEKV